jgi:uncharacterized OsmC-like protein
MVAGPGAGDGELSLQKEEISMSDSQFTVRLEQIKDFEFKVAFDWPDVDDIVADEPEPLGTQKGPNASRLLAAAVANCLTASLYFCLKKSRVEVDGFRAEVQGEIIRNESKRLRIGGFRVRIEAPVTGAEGKKLDRCLGLFEDFCVVTASVRQGIPVEVEVVDREGDLLFSSREE